MDGQQNTATIDELIRAIRFAGTEQRRTLHSWLVTGHFVFGGLAVAAWLVALICKLAGHQIGDRLTDEYFFSLMTSVMFFAVGTLMIEYMRGDIFAQALGRVLAGCGLFVMSAQGYEFMQESRAIEIETSILAKSRPVSDEQTFIREITNRHFTVSFESKEDGNGWGRPVFSARGRSCSENAGTARASRTADRLLRTESTGTATTNGTASF